MENKDTLNSGTSEKEIDLVEVVKKLWHKRKFILKVTLIFACLGIFVALFSSKEFTASCTMVPQTGEKNVGGNLGGLAAMAGINLGSNVSGDVLSPKIYPRILASVPFQKELLETKIKFKEYEQPVTLLDYYTNDKYQKFSLIGTVAKYTIGLPGIIMQAIRGEQQLEGFTDTSSQIQSLSKGEDIAIKSIKGNISLSVNDKDGYVSLAVNMPEALASAQLASAVQTMLQKYITEFKIQKVQSNLDFVESRYAEAKRDFEAKQSELAAFRDANRSFASAVAQTTQERLKNEYDLLFSVYTELAKQREQANIQVKETTPIFTIVEPVTIPMERSKPKRGLICIAFTFLGGFIGIGLVLSLPFLAQVSGNKRLAKWLPENRN